MIWKWNLSDKHLEYIESYTVNIVAVDALITPEARASAAMILSRFSRNMQASVPKQFLWHNYIHFESAYVPL